MPHNEDRKSQYDEVYEVNEMGWRDFNWHATLDLDYYLLAQYTSDELDKADGQDRKLYVFDNISRQVKWLLGHAIQNEHVLKIGPMGNYEEQEDEACNQHTGVAMSDMARLGGYDILSEAFKWGALVEGSNLIERWRDRDNILQFGRLGYNQFQLDSGLTKPDLSDCADIQTGQWITTAKAKMMVPTKADDIEQIEPITSSPRWQFQSDPAMQNRAGKRLFEQWWHRETEEVDVVASRQTGNEMEFSKFVTKHAQGDKQLALQIIDTVPGPNGAPALVKFRKMKDKIRLTIFIDDRFLWEGPNPTKLRDYNYTWFHGEWCPECTQSSLKLKGHVRGLRDPQSARNRRIGQVLDLVESQAQGVRTVRSQYLINPEEAYKAGQGVVLQTSDKTPDAMPLKEIFTQTPASEVPVSLFKAVEMVSNAETEAGGMNETVVGDDSKVITGVLHKYRTNIALIGQAWMFKDFRASKRDLGRKHVRLVQLNYTSQQIQKLLNQPPAQGFFDEDLMRFDCNPTEGLLTDSQQNMYYQELKELLREFPDLFQDIITADMLVKASPMQFKSATLKLIQQAQQAKQQAQQKGQQQEQLGIQLQQALIATQVARAQEDSADAAEARSQIPLNNAKTISEINKNQASPLVDMLKEMVKLEIAQHAQLQAQNAGTGA